MPLAQITMVEGRTKQQKKRLIEEVTDAIVRTIDAPKESIRVSIMEIPADNWGVGGVPKSELPPS